MTVHLEHFLEEIGAELPVTGEDKASNRRGVGATEKVTDALKSNPGTQVAPENDLRLTPQEEYLHQHHLKNLSQGGVKNPDGTVSTLRQMDVDVGGKIYNLPTVWDNKILTPEESIERAKKEGINNFPSYPTREDAQKRYEKMHDMFEKEQMEVERKEHQSSIPIMRHGETIENKDDTAHGWSNEPLIPEGRKEVEKTANTLAASNPPSLIAHSDLKRAAESAQIVADKTGAETLAIPELRTWDIGNFAGMKCGECEKQLKEYVDNPDKRVPGGESFNDFRRRVTEGFHKAMSAGADMIVTHNKTERMIAAMEKSETPHEVFDHNGGPEPGQMRKIRLAGDVLPFTRIPMAGARSTGARGRQSITDFEDQAYFKGEQYAPDTSKVSQMKPKPSEVDKNYEENIKGMTPEQKRTYDNFLQGGKITVEDIGGEPRLTEYDTAVIDQQKPFGREGPRKEGKVLPGPQNMKLFQVKEPGAFGVDSPGFAPQLGKRFLEQHPDRYRPMHGEMEWDRYNTGKELRGGGKTSPIKKELEDLPEPEPKL